MAGDKAWKLSASPTLHLSSVVPRRPQSHLCPEGSFEADGSRISWGKKGMWPHAGWSVWGHAVCPCLPCPQRGPRRSFWSVWPPRRHPKNLPPLNFYAIGWKLFNIYLPIDVFFFEREGLWEAFYASNSSRGKDHKQALVCLHAFYWDIF